jgi:hypothetical protein
VRAKMRAWGIIAIVGLSWLLWEGIEHRAIVSQLSELDRLPQVPRAEGDDALRYYSAAIAGMTATPVVGRSARAAIRGSIVRGLQVGSAESMIQDLSRRNEWPLKMSVLGAEWPLAPSAPDPHVTRGAAVFLGIISAHTLHLLQRADAAAATESVVSGLRMLRLFGLGNGVQYVFQRAHSLHEMVLDAEALFASKDLELQHLAMLSDAFEEAVVDADIREAIRRDALLRMRRAVVVTWPFGDERPTLSTTPWLLAVRRPAVLRQGAHIGRIASELINEFDHAGSAALMRRLAVRPPGALGVPVSLSARKAAEDYERAAITIMRSIAVIRCVQVAIDGLRSVLEDPTLDIIPQFVAATLNWRDPFTGNPLMAAAGDGIISIYSVGEDLEDQGGELRSLLPSQGRDVGIQIRLMIH